MESATKAADDLAAGAVVHAIRQIIGEFNIDDCPMCGGNGRKHQPIYRIDGRIVICRGGDLLTLARATLALAGLPETEQ